MGSIHCKDFKDPEIHQVFVELSGGLTNRPTNCIQTEQQNDKYKRAQWFIIDVKYMVPPFGDHSCLSASGRPVIRTAIPSGVQLDF